MNPNREHPNQHLPTAATDQNTSTIETQIHESSHPDSRRALKSNWFRSLTRRKRQPKTNANGVVGGTSTSQDNLDETTSAKSFGHRKHSIMCAFNKCMQFGTKSARRSSSYPVGLASVASPDRVSSVSTNVCSDPIANAQTIECTQQERKVEPEKESSLWWESMDPKDAPIYRARIEMNPFGWYRGGMERDVSQKKLQGQPNGSFLVRDSQTPGCHFTLSFRSAGITLHYRIENTDGLWVIESCRFDSMVGLIQHAQHLSHDQILCYVKPSSQLQQPFPVRLINPISKFDEVPSLQHICRYVARGHLPDAALNYLPVKLREYVRQKPFLERDIGYFET